MRFLSRHTAIFDLEAVGIEPVYSGKDDRSWRLRLSRILYGRH